MAKDKQKSGKSSDWEKRLAEQASEDRAREKASAGGGGSKISIQKRRFVLGGEVLGKELTGVVMDWVYLKTFYKKAFKQGEYSAPNCYAMGPDDELSPHDKVKKPVNDTCEGCPHNEFGTAKQGQGKACSDKRRLALIASDDIEDAKSVKRAEIAFLEIPPTSLGGWTEYLDELKDKIKRPIHTVVTKISIDPDSDWPKPLFELVEKIEDEEVVDAIEARQEDVRDDLLRPYPDEDEIRKKGKKGKQKDDDDDEDEDDDEDDEEDDDDDDEAPTRKKGKGASKRKSSDEDDDEDDDDDDGEDDDDDDESEDDDDEEEEKPRKKGRKPRKDDDEDEDEDSDDDDDDDDDDDEKPRKRKRSRFGK